MMPVYGAHRLIHGGLAAAAAAACLLAFAAGVAGCGEDASPRPLVLTEEHDGQIVQAAVGDTVEVRLGENPSTGYVWTFTTSDGLESHGDQFIAPATSAPVVGAPGTRVSTFVVTGPGRQQIVGVYARPWEARPAVPDFSLILDVE